MKLDIRQRAAILVAIISGSILVVGATLAATTSFAALGFLTLGAPFEYGVMGIIWFIGTVMWITGSLVVSKWIATEVWIICGVIVAINGAIAGVVSNPYYTTILVPSIFAVVMTVTFVHYAINFAGIHELDENK